VKKSWTFLYVHNLNGNLTAITLLALKGLNIYFKLRVMLLVCYIQQTPPNSELKPKKLKLLSYQILLKQILRDVNTFT